MDDINKIDFEAKGLNLDTEMRFLWLNSYLSRTFFPSLMHNSANKLGHFRQHTIVFICYKHSGLSVRIGKQVKTKFNRIGTWFGLQTPL